MKARRQDDKEDATHPRDRAPPVVLHILIHPRGARAPQQPRIRPHIHAHMCAPPRGRLRRVHRGEGAIYRALVIIIRDAYHAKKAAHLRHH
jgi:hypothetical protein